MVRLPRALRAQLDDALRELSAGSLERIEPVGGGCINNGARVVTSHGTACFLKWNASAGSDLFDAEADGLRALRDARALRAPEPLTWGGGGDAPGWLLLEHLEPSAPSPGYAEALGRGLAALHSAEVESTVGWHRDNWIGSLPQSNPPGSTWGGFWRNARIVPQLERARARGHLAGRDGAVMDDLVDRIGAALADVDRAPPSLLHGDLWGGNAYPGPAGVPVVIDPAVYRGHREVDLAMTELFGGFGPAFYRAYDEAAPLDERYGAYRRDLYQLYYLLVHVNLFGGSYVSGTLAAARRVVGALG